MKIIILMLLLFFSYSCSQENLNETDVVSNPQQFDRDYLMKEVSMACEMGCMYHYDIYNSANQLVKNAVSLTKAQLESIQKECKNYCVNAVFIKINQRNNNEQVKNIKIESKPKEEEKEVLEEKKEEIKQKEKKEADDELTPFEEL